MKRRHFLELAAGAGVGAFASSACADPAVGPDETARRFAAALKGKPWLLGFKGLKDGSLETSSLAISGRLPADLSGRFYRNGPAVHEIAGFRYRHWFDGDGMVQRFVFKDGQLSHLGRVVDTEKRRIEREAGRAVLPAFGTVPPDPQAISGNDTMNTANINVVERAGKLLALWEGGSPYALDPATLDAKGPVHFSEPAAGAPFSAHPRVEVDGSTWNFGIAGWLDKVLIWRLRPDGTLADLRACDVETPGMPHDFVVTRRHIVLPLPPVALDKERLGSGSTSFLDAHRWHGERPLRLMVLAKDDLSTPRWAELPAGFIFHYGNAWEDESGVIRFDACRYDDATILTRTFRDVMVGDDPTAAGGGTAYVRLDTSTLKAEMQLLPEQTEFPRVDHRLIGQRHRFLYAVGDRKVGSDRAWGFGSVQRRDLESGEILRFDYPAHVIAEEHVVVPKPRSDPDGDAWLIGTSLDWKMGITRVSVFEAARLSDGPIAIASLPYALPLGFHGNFYR
jgi:all-trans-8'-apo-beta-carotenal 15,15'-oxygenase